MVFDISVAMTWILFLALFPISFVWLRRAWRIVVNRDFSEVAIKRGESPPNAKTFAPYEMAINLVAGAVLGVCHCVRSILGAWRLRHLERGGGQHHLVQIFCQLCAQPPCPRQVGQGQGLIGFGCYCVYEQLDGTALKRLVWLVAGWR
jgi:hypothetical protein